MEIGDTITLLQGKAVVIEIHKDWIKVRVFKAYDMFDLGKVLILENKKDD